MDEYTPEQLEEALAKEMRRRLGRAASYMASVLRAQWPKRTGKTAAGIRGWVNTKDGQSTAVVKVPFPGQFVEFGVVAPFRPANPIARRAAINEWNNVLDILTGNEY